MNDLVREYGGALFELADEEKKADLILGETRAIKGFFGRDTDYARLLSSPTITAEERVKIAGEAFDGKVDKFISSFIKMMTERGYARYIGECFDEYERRYYDKNNMSVVTVRSVVELTDAQKSALIDKLKKRTGKNIELRCSIDPSLIGGISVYVDGKLYDGSVSAHIEKVRRSLYGITIN